MKKFKLLGLLGVPVLCAFMLTSCDSQQKELVYTDETGTEQKVLAKKTDNPEEVADIINALNSIEAKQVPDYKVITVASKNESTLIGVDKTTNKKVTNKNFMSNETVYSYKNSETATGLGALDYYSKSTLSMTIPNEEEDGKVSQFNINLAAELFYSDYVEYMHFIKADLSYDTIPLPADSKNKLKEAVAKDILNKYVYVDINTLMSLVGESIGSSVNSYFDIDTQFSMLNMYSSYFGFGANRSLEYIKSIVEYNKIAVVDVSDSTVTFKTKEEDSSDYSLLVFDINTKNVVKYEADSSQSYKEMSEKYDNMEVSKCVSKHSISIKKGGTLKTISENDKESAKDLMEVIPSEIIDYIKNMRDDDYLK